MAKESEARLEQIIRGMRYIKLVVYPMEAFEEAAEFVEGLANVFDAASGARIKSALAQTLTQIFEPVIMVCSLPALGATLTVESIILRAHPPRSTTPSGPEPCRSFTAAHPT